MTKKQLFKLIRINKRNEYVFKKANSIDVINSMPQNILYFLGVSKPLVFIKLKPIKKDEWDKLKQ